MFEDIFLVVYGVTVLFFFIGFTASVIRGRWDNKMVAAAEHAVEKVEQQSGLRFEVSVMKAAIEICSIVVFLLPVINTLVMVKTFANKRKTNRAIAKAVNEHTKVLDD